MPKAGTIVRTYAYRQGDTYYKVRVTLDPRELARESIRKGLLGSKTKRAVRANGAVTIEASAVSQHEAQAITAQEEPV